MRSIYIETLPATVAWMLLALAPLTAVAAPILGDPSLAGVPDGTRRLSEYEIVANGDPAGLADPGTFDVSSSERLGSYRRGATSALETNALFDPRADAGGQYMFDSLRSFVNIAPAAGTRRVPAARANSAPRNDVLDWVDLGPEARAWIHDSFKSIVDSALQLEVNERGRMSFSVLGFGDFGVAVSADRSQIAFTSNDAVLLTAQRGSDAAAASGPGGGPYGGAGWTQGSSAPVNAGDGKSPLRKALELAFEIATHPLSMMVYLIIAAYILLWTVLNRQPHKRGHHARREAHVHRTVTASGRSRRRHRSRRHHRN